MPIFTYEADNNQQNIDNPDGTNIPNIRRFMSSDEAGTSILFDKEHDLDNIIPYITGMKWTVDYFSNIRGVNDDVRELDINIPVTLQSYNRINDLVLYVQTSIPQDTISNITGNAIINAGIVPSVNDVFLAKLANGDHGIFIVTNVDKRDYTAHKCYYIDYKLFALTSEKVELYNNLIYKVQREYVYDSNYVIEYGYPILLKKDYSIKLDVKKKIPELLDYYFKNFYSIDKKLITLPTENNICYDGLLTDFLFKIVNIDMHPILNKVKRLIYTDNSKIDYTIWDVLINKDKSLLKLCSKDIDFIKVKNNINYATILDFSIYNINYVADIIGNNVIFNSKIIDVSNKDIIVTEPPIATNTFGIYTYVFSEYFYKDNPEKCGYLEKLILDYLDNKIIDSKYIYRLLEEYKGWNTKTQFYGIPMIILLIKYFYSSVVSEL